MDRIIRCQTCHIGFPKLGRLTPEMRLENHANIIHEHKCHECGAVFVSDAHIKYHLKYVHDNKCLHCHSYCGGDCSETYGRAMETNEQSQNDKITIVEETEIELEELVEEKINEHLDAVQNIATSIDIGYSDFEAEKWCKLIYFPSPMTPKRNLSQKILWWMCLESYESSVDAQTLDARSLEVERCAYKGCGYTFLDIHSHYWQFHPEFSKPNTKTPNLTNGTVTGKGFKEIHMDQKGSNPVEETESVDMVIPR